MSHDSDSSLSNGNNNDPVPELHVVGQGTARTIWDERGPISSSDSRLWRFLWCLRSLLLVMSYHSFLELAC